ncbi:hypothetical protein [Coleofasciculus sp. F4-SAH-05]|uniref:hypothetical protein n=1 Tax=Coleofasciculus sp. F4-SAH-05 TaxID=3069525 RepID=UPI003304876E
MSNTLLIPIHLDALCLEEQTQVAKPLADYRSLPFLYQYQNQEGNWRTWADGTANLSEKVLTPLFESGLTTAKAGIHLHWSLPDALTRGEHTATGTKFPLAPNRWLILRQGGTQGDKQWVIESDYLYPENTDPADTTIILMERPNPETLHFWRHRYMGRKLELTEWQQEQSSHPAQDYAQSLTAIGPKAEVPLFDSIQATFAAFYPNCQSVFGFHDADYPMSNPPSGLQYDVIGWYSDEQQDCLATWLENNPGKSTEELLELLEEEFGWTCELNGEFPDRTLYHARVTFAPTARALSARDRTKSLPKPTVAVGNSAPEALSAYLAHSYNSDTNQTGTELRQIVQEKLEALQLSEHLESRQLDLDATLREARHKRGFATRRGGILWSIQPQLIAEESQVQVTLPPELAQQLIQVNQLQEEYNQSLATIESMHQQLYAHWYEYMQALYGERGTGNDRQINRDTTDKSLNPLRKALSQTGQLDIQKDETGNLRVTAATLSFGILSVLSGYLDYYVGVLEAAVNGNFSNWSDIEVEFENCNVEFSDNPTVTIVTEGQVWAIHDQEQTYHVKVENSVLTIYIPPTYNPVSGIPQLANGLATAINQLMAAIATHNQTHANQYILKQFPSQAYWRPNDPVLLLAGGETTKASVRHHSDGRLRRDNCLYCHLFDVSLDLETLPNATINSLQSQIKNCQPAEGEDSIDFKTWTQQPWNPILMQWAMQVFPSRPNSPAAYEETVILDNYRLERNAIDLTLKDGKESNFVPVSNTYQGLSILTPAAEMQLSERVITYLNEQLLPFYYQAHNIPPEQQTEDFLSENFDDIANWYKSRDDIASLDPKEQAQDPIFVALWAYPEIQDLDSQAQAMGGFNDTLLLYQPTLQLEIDDPLSEQQIAFHEQIRWTLGNTLQYKILYGDTFNPIRSGAMKITTLWLVDTFGQIKRVIETGGDSQVVTTTQMTPPNQQYQVLLPPRLAQPARLNFYWLAADTIKDMTATPTVSPVCGWLVVNNLDSTLLVYDAGGKALGLIDRAGNWRMPPGSTLSRDGRGYPQLANVHLQKVVHYLLELGAAFQQEFLSTVANSLETIDPENFAEHPSLALLVERPIAVVRASFNLEVQGLPISDPNISVMELETITDDRNTIIGTVPNTSNFDRVKFQIRLGDYQQLNDGLVGYWRETHGEEGYEYEGNIFYAPQSNRINHELIQTEAEGIVYFQQTVDAAPQFVTMLIDPRGIIHTTTGILPNQELRLSPENYNSALQAIEVTFLSTPVLSSHNQVSLPLPEVPDYSWSWLSVSNGIWSETTTITPVNPQATFSAPQKLYEGWLQLTPASAEDVNDE